MIIYRVSNLKNKKSYIGLTSLSLKERKEAHLKNVKSGSNLIFHNALRKYGTKNFSWKTIYKARSFEELYLMEKYFISLCNSFFLDGFGYNMTLGGEGTLGKTLSQKTKNKMSKARKGIPKSTEHKLKIGLAHKGISKSPDHRKKISLTKKGQLLSESHKRKLRKARKQNPLIGSKNGMFGKIGKLNKKSKKYKITNLSGKSKIVFGLHEFSEEKSFPYTSLISACNSGKIYRGYKIQRL